MFEQSCVRREIEGDAPSRFGLDCVRGSAWRWHLARAERRPGSEGVMMGDGVSFPSTRAALVLSTVGCDWREGSA